jgi:hypothetical protein
VQAMMTILARGPHDCDALIVIEAQKRILPFSSEIRVCTKTEMRRNAIDGAECIQSTIFRVLFTFLP